MQYLMDVGFADSDFAGCGETAVANVGNAAASGLRHDGFEADDFMLEPFGFFWGMAMVIPAGGMWGVVAVARGSDWSTAWAGIGLVAFVTATW